MTTNHTNSSPDAVILVADPAGVLYAVPAATLDTFRVPAERRAQLPALQTVAPEAAVYALTVDALAPYRLSDAQRQLVHMQLKPPAGEEVHGTALFGDGSVKFALADASVRFIAPLGVTDGTSNTLTFLGGVFVGAHPIVSSDSF
jgi:hypothetical protein